MPPIYDVIGGFRNFVVDGAEGFGVAIAEVATIPQLPRKGGLPTMKSARGSSARRAWGYSSSVPLCCRVARCTCWKVRL